MAMLYHDSELMLKVHRMVRAGWSYRQAALSLGITKDKVARIMRTFKMGKAKVEGRAVVQVLQPHVSRARRKSVSYVEGYQACLDDLLKAANDVLSLAREKWPQVFGEEESRRMLGYVKDVHGALEARAPQRPERI